MRKNCSTPKHDLWNILRQFSPYISSRSVSKLTWRYTKYVARRTGDCYCDCQLCQHEQLKFFTGGTRPSTTPTLKTLHSDSPRTSPLFANGRNESLIVQPCLLKPKRSHASGNFQQNSVIESTKRQPPSKTLRCHRTVPSINHR